MSDQASVGAPALFVDLEGTLVDDMAFGTGSGPIRFAHGALAALAGLAKAGFRIVIVTSQSGLALGHFSRSQLTLREAVLHQQLRYEAGVRLTDFLVCPHRPGADGAPACLCRMPASGLLIRAARAHRLELAASWMVGDSLDDIEAGRRVGCGTVLLDAGVMENRRASPLRTPDRRCAGWSEVAQSLIGGCTQAHALP